MTQLSKNCKSPATNLIILRGALLRGRTDAGEVAKPTNNTNDRFERDASSHSKSVDLPFGGAMLSR